MLISKRYGYTARTLAWLLIISLSLLPVAGVGASAASQAASEAPITIYFFWGDGCPHCADEEPFLAELHTRYPQIQVLDYEVWHSQENQALFTQMAAAYGLTPPGVPVTFIADAYWVGFNEQIGREIEAKVAACAETVCPETGAGAIPAPRELILTLPIVGTINLEAQSLLISTLLIAFVDGFNPCSLWVLSILLALTLHTGSRKKVFVIGFVFITVSAAIYMVFITGLFTILSIASFLGWIQVGVALLALFFALVNIKDYFWYKEGLSFTIADEKKPGIYKRMRKVLKAEDSLWALISATFMMAAGVSLVEFSCTAGFPVLWSNLLSAQNVTAAEFALLLAVYMLVYQLDEMAIFLVAVFTLRASRLEEKHGRILKLIGGMLMLTLSAVMIFKPSLMDSLSSSLIIFGVAFGGAITVLLLHRYVLPRLGIHIGTEFQAQEK